MYALFGIHYFVSTFIVQLMIFCSGATLLHSCRLRTNMCYCNYTLSQLGHSIWYDITAQQSDGSLGGGVEHFIMILPDVKLEVKSEFPIPMVKEEEEV